MNSEAAGGSALVEVIQDVLDLDDKQAEAFAFLLRRGEAAATDVARATHQSRGAAYTCLRALVGAGVVSEIPTRPITFRPLPVGDLVREGRRVTQQRIAALDQVAANVAAEETVPCGPSATLIRPGDVTVASGRRAALSELRRSIDDATATFWGLGAVHAPARILRSAPLVMSLQDAAQRGVDVRLHLARTATGEATFQRLRDAISPTLIHPPPEKWPGNVTLAVSDHTALVYVPQPVSGDAHGEDILVRLQGEPFVQLLSRLFPSDGSGHDEAIGPSWNVVVEACREAKQEVLWMRGAPGRPPPEVERGLAAAVPPTVDARRLRTQSQSALATDDRWNDRVVSAAPFWFTLIDETRLFQSTPALNDEEGVVLRKSQDPDEVAFYREAFLRTWARGEPVAEEIASDTNRH